MADECNDDRPKGIMMNEISDLDDVVKELAVSGSPKNVTKSIDSVSLTMEKLKQIWKAAPLEDCPICMVPLPRDQSLSVYLTCCGKQLCSSCIHLHEVTIDGLNEKRAEDEKPPLPLTCPFCRCPPPHVRKEYINRYECRAGQGDAYATFTLSYYYREGMHGLNKDEKKANNLLHQEAELGHADAMCYLGKFYFLGGVVLSRASRRAYL